ncbi:LacI family DNA-binding transcriptional regulator [Abiotrophia defectiva]
MKDANQFSAKATMKDVAERAGVGLGTVSRVVNGFRVKDSTYEKVQIAIRELNYQPDEYARGLKTNRSNIVALIVPTIWHPFFSQFAYHVEKELQQHHYKLLICNADGDASNEIEYIEMLKKNKVDGIIGITYSDIDKYILSSLPLVSIDRHFSENVYYVTSENYEGGQLAAKELLERGAKQLAYIGGTNIHENETVLRKAGFYDYSAKQGYNVAKLDMPEPIDDVEGRIRAFVEEHADLDGFFTVNDFMALHVMKVMQALGKSCPEDYQLIGFDGLKTAEGQDYLLSTIAQPIDQMAIAAVDLLMTLIKGQVQPSSHRVILPVHFREGGTTRKKLN